MIEYPDDDVQFKLSHLQTGHLLEECITYKSHSSSPSGDFLRVINYLHSSSTGANLKYWRFSALSYHFHFGGVYTINTTF